MNYARKSIIKLSPYVCARDMFKEGVLLDANENYQQWVRIDWTKVTDLNRYFDSTAEKLREKIVEKYVRGFGKDNIFVGAGSDQIIDLLLRTFVEDDEYIMVMDPSYPLYEIQAEVNRVKTKRVLLNPDFSLNIEAIKNNINKVKILFLCSPNNPTGNLISPKEIEEILNFYSGLLVIDEAYIEFAGLEKSLIDFVDKHQNVMIIRTFSKAWGLAGLRLGYLISHPEIIHEILKVKDSYNTTALSQKVALQALDQVDGLWKSVTEVKELKTNLETEFKNMGYEITPTFTNFILVRIKNSKELGDRLAEMGVIVRDKSNENYLEDTIRITIGSPEENKLLINSIRKITGK